MDNTKEKSAAEEYADYLEQRMELNALKIVDYKARTQDFKKKGFDEASAEKLAREAQNKNLNSYRMSAGDVKNKLGKKLVGTAGKALLRSGLTMSSPFLIVCLLLGCFAMFFILGFTASVKKDPTKFLNLECGSAALGNNSAIKDCMKQTVQQNTGTSFGNQGLTI
jgi:hypothetical protein